METYNPILKIENVKRGGIRPTLPQIPVGTALVLVGRDGKLTVLKADERPRASEWLFGGYTRAYLVDLSTRLLERTTELSGPSNAFTIAATFLMTCRVTDPAEIVRHHIEDVGALLWPQVERRVHTAISKSGLDHILATREVLDKALDVDELHPAFVVQVHVILEDLRDKLGSALARHDEEQHRRDYSLHMDRLELLKMLSRHGHLDEVTVDMDVNELLRELERRAPVHVHARMDPELVRDQVVSVQVIVSREAIRHVLRPTEMSGQADADPKRSILVEVIARANLVTVGGSRQEVPIPAPNEPRVLFFDVRATHTGEGELWVVARQGPLPLLTLVLRPQLVSQQSSSSATEQAASGVAMVGTLDGPLTVLRIHEERHGDAVVYRYDLDAPELGFTRAYASRLIEQDRDTYVRGLFHRIETAWVASCEDAAAFQEQLRAFGADLLDELVPVELQRDLWTYHEQLAHIVVLSTEPFIPWELVHLKNPATGRLPDDTQFLAQLGLVRWLWQPQQPGRHGNVRLPERLSVRPGRARYLIPDYPDPAWRLAALPAERAILERRLDASPITPHHAEVLSVLRDPDGFDLLHFAGHGRATSDHIADAELLLQGRIAHGKYKPEPLPVAVVRHNFRATPAGPSPIVILNACQTGRLGHQLSSIGGFAEAFISGGAGAFISSLWSVGDSPALTFVESLYDTLLAGEPMAAAVRAARNRARAAGDATWLAYSVYAHPQARLIGPDQGSLPSDWAGSSP